MECEGCCGKTVWHFRVLIFILKIKKGLCLKFYRCAQLCLTFFNPMNCSLPGSSVHEDFPAKNTGVGCHALLQGIFPTQGSNPGLPYCGQILYQLSYKGSPCIGWRSELSKGKTLSQCVTWGQSSLILLLLKTCKHHLHWLSNTFLHFLQPLKFGQLEASPTGQS